MELPKQYSPQESEKDIYKKWEESGYFSPDHMIQGNVISPDAPAFSIVLPPPNVTGTLHIGHGIMLAIEDAFVRFYRMRGHKALWIPGTDHAAIATQSRVEKELYKKEKKTRHDLGREQFVKMVEEFAQESQNTILSQVREMGASVDWSRQAYTLDKRRSNAVITAFKKMYEDELIYKGDRIVNWDPKMQTTISDDEIEWIEEKTPLYYLKFGDFTISTARPETKFGDKYIVVHPDDKRYAKYKHKQKIEMEWINGAITATVIKDESIDMEFGTGAMTITPWHDSTDFVIAEKHNLDREQVISEYGKLLPIAQEFEGMSIKKARPLIIQKLKEKGLLEKIDGDYTHRIATNSRGGGVIEPQIRTQWWVNVSKEFTIQNSHINGIESGTRVTLKDIMRKPVETGQITIYPDRFKKIYFHWIDNLQDWNISRQLWYGHRVPVWYKGNEQHCGAEPPEKQGWEQDPDTLDTWFSSGLWTFSTMGWNDDTTDEMKQYHPTTLMETGYDILFFWVARMILMSGYLLGDIPFENVYLHGLVRDEKGRKMSKSLDNIIDPRDLIAKYGADATRMALLAGNPAGADTSIYDNKVKAYKHYANKIWNIARFILLQTEGYEMPKKAPSLTPRDKEILDKAQTIETKIIKNIQGYKLHLAIEDLYQFTWHEFADKILEESKPVLQDDKTKASRQYVLLKTLTNLLVLHHPFMPFITETLWHNLPHTEGLLMTHQNTT